LLYNFFNVFFHIFSFMFLFNIGDLKDIARFKRH